MSKADFFIAAVNDDQETLQALIKFANSLDGRKSSNKDKIIHGFGAIHYAAILGRLEALKFLLPHELYLKTGDLATFRSAHYSKSAFQVALEQDCLHIALAKGQWQAVDEILLFLRQSEVSKQPSTPEEIGQEKTAQRYDLSESRDIAGMSHLELLCKFPSTPEVLTLLENSILLKECVYKDRKINCMQMACFNGRHKTVEKLIDVSKQKYEMRRQIFLMITSVGSFGETIFDLMKKEINYELNECTQQDRELCKEWILRILPNALAYLNATPEHEKHLRRFEKHYKPDGTVTLPEFDFDSKNLIDYDEGLIINEDFFLPEGCRGRLII